MPYLYTRTGFRKGNCQPIVTSDEKLQCPLCKDKKFSTKGQVYSHLASCAKRLKDSEGRIINKATRVLVTHGLVTAVPEKEQVLPVSAYFFPLEEEESHNFVGDYNLDDDDDVVNTDNDMLLKPTYEYFLYQMSIARTYKPENGSGEECALAELIHTGRRSSKRKSNDTLVENKDIRVQDNTIRFKWQDYLQIYNFVNQLNLSQRDGDLFLQTVKDISQRHNLDLPLPLNYKTILRCVEKKTDFLHGVQDVEIKLPAHIFGEELSDTLLPAKGSVINVLEVVSEMLLNEAVVGSTGERLHMDFNLLKDPDTGDRQVNSVNSSEWFRKTEECIKSDVTLRKDTKLMALIFSYDAASVNLKTNSTITPLYVSIGNIENDNGKRCTENIGFIGFFPKLTYTDEQILSILDNNKRNLKVRQELLRLTKSYLQQKYLELVLEPIYKCQSNGGFVACVHGLIKSKDWGVNPHPVLQDNADIGEDDDVLDMTNTVIFFPAICCFCMDNQGAAAHLNLGISNKSRYRCRKCYISGRNLQRAGQFGRARPFRKCQKKADIALEALIMKWRGEPISMNAKSAMEYCSKRNIMKIPVTFMNKHRYFTESNVYDICPFDDLHTMCEGMLKNWVIWTVVCAASASKLDPERFGNALLHLDSALMSFPVLLIPEVLRRHKFSKGITSLVKSTVGASASRSKREGATSGLGSLEAQKIPMLLLQMLCCLVPEHNQNSKILPSNKKWMEKNCPWIKPTKSLNVLEIAIKSGITLLDIHYNLRRTSWSTTTLRDLKQSIHTCRFFFNLLWNCKQDLVNSEKEYTGWKSHMLEHVVDDIILYGPVQNYSMIWYEQAHKTVVKKSYKKISKRHDTFLTDMTKKARLGMILRLVERTVFSRASEELNRNTWTQEAEEMRNRYATAPGTELCTPGARARLIERRTAFVNDKITRKSHFIHYKAAGNTTFEENILAHKLQIFLIPNEEDPEEYHIFSESNDTFTSKRMLLYFHPCIRGKRQIRDMSVDFQRELTLDNPYLKQLTRHSPRTSLFLLQSVKFDGEDNGIPLTHLYSTRNFNPSSSSRKATTDNAVPNTTQNLEDIDEEVEDRGGTGPRRAGRGRSEPIQRFDFVEVMYDDDDGVSQTGMAQILAIIALNRKYRTKQVLFYIQWLQEDNVPPVPSAVSRSTATGGIPPSSSQPRYLPFGLLRYERVLDRHGRKSNTYARQFITAECINRPAFVIPTSILLADAHKEIITDTRTFLNIPYLFFNRVNNTAPTTYLRDADRRFGAQRGATDRGRGGGGNHHHSSKDFRYVLDSNAIPALSAFWLYNRRRYRDNFEEDEESDEESAQPYYDALQEVETEPSDVSSEEEQEDDYGEQEYEEEEKRSSSDMEDEQHEEGELQDDDDTLVHEEEAQEMQRLFED